MKPWGGRFQQKTDRRVEAFTASIPFDQRLYRQDIAGSIAHSRMLARQGIISPQESDAIIGGLKGILADIERSAKRTPPAEGEFEFSLELEDIHMNVEARLKERIGEVAGKLHTARSRNDQVALDMRLYVREAIVETVEALAGLQKALLDLAESHRDAVMPGYTHLQRAQPILFAHHLLAYVEMLQRDAERFQDAYRRADVMPLGAGALAGVPYPIDREFVARELGFSEVARNSIDAVADRDFVVEYISAAATTMMHLSRLSEELVLWSSAEFGFVEMSDAYATGSSIMPQKKNPDVAELIRGKTGRVYGHLTAILTVLKGLPLAYNKDLQEDKEGLFDTVDTLLPCLELMSGMLGTLQVKEDRMRAAADWLLLATDIADYLVAKGLPFREAHGVVGRLVRSCLDRGRSFHDLSLEDYRAFSLLFAEDVREVSAESSVRARNSYGGTAPERVAEVLAVAGRLVEGNVRWAEEKRGTLPRG